MLNIIYNNPQLYKYMNLEKLVDKHQIVTSKYNKECSICNKTDNSLLSYLLPCTHIAHIQCYKKWIIKSGKPTCNICGYIKWFYKENYNNIILAHAFNMRERKISDNNFSIFNAYKINKITIYDGDDNHHTNMIEVTKELDNLNIVPVTKKNDYEFGNRPRELDIKIDFNFSNMVSGVSGKKSLLIYFHKGIYSIRWDDENPHVFENSLPESLTNGGLDKGADVCLHISRVRIYNEKNNNRDQVLTIMGGLYEDAVKIEKVNKENNYWFGNNIGDLDIVMEFHNELNGEEGFHVDKTLEVCSIGITSQIRWK